MFDKFNYSFSNSMVLYFSAYYRVETQGILRT